MKKNKLLVVLLMPLLLLLPFGNYANAQVPSYVGVAAGEQYTWKAEVEFGNVDELLTNARAVIVDMKANLPSLDLNGLESMTVEDMYQEIAEVYLSYVLPDGWESLNITDLIEETFEYYIEQFNSTFLSGMIPSNWLSLNFSDFYDLAVDGLNATLLSSQPGWNDNPLPELYMLVINELNSTILYGLIPAGWEAMTLGDLIESLMTVNAPVLWESFVVQMMLDTFFSLALPPEMLDDTISELIYQLIAMLPTEITSINATTMFEEIFFGMNQTMPGIESETMANVLDMLGDMVNSTMPSGYGELNMSSLLETVIENDLYGILYPPEMAGMTYLEILDMAYTEAINAFDLTILPAWADMYTMLQGMGMASFEAGLRVIINSLGTEVESFPGGPKGVPINMDYLVSYGSEEWLNVSEMLGLTGDFSLIGLFFNSFIFGMTGLMMAMPPPEPPPPIGLSMTITPLIVDPTTYSIVQTALSDQFLFTGTLIVANNYNWGSIQTELIMVTSGNPDAIVMSAVWNSNGVLQRADVKTDGLVVAALTLVGEESGEIPGFEIPIILGISSVALIAIISHLKRKNKIIK